MLQTLQWSSPTRSRKCFFQYATTCVPGCQRCHATERPSPGLNDKIFRYTNSFVTHDAVPAQHEPLLFHGGVPLALPAPTKSIRFLGLRNLTFKTALSGLGTQCGVVRCRSRLGTLCGTIFSTAEGLFCKCPRDGCLNCLAGATRTFRFELSTRVLQRLLQEHGRSQLVSHCTSISTLHFPFEVVVCVFLPRSTFDDSTCRNCCCVHSTCHRQEHSPDRENVDLRVTSKSSPRAGEILPRSTWEPCPLFVVLSLLDKTLSRVPLQYRQQCPFPAQRCRSNKFIFILFRCCNHTSLGPCDRRVQSIPFNTLVFMTRSMLAQVA